MRPAQPEGIGEDGGIQTLAAIHVEAPAQQRVGEHKNGERGLEREAGAATGGAGLGRIGLAGLRSCHRQRERNRGPPAFE